MEYSNPFDRLQGQFLILQNSQQHYSLWPEHCALPAGWQVICGAEGQQQCYDWLDKYWQELVPASFVAPVPGKNHGVPDAE